MAEVLEPPQPLFASRGGTSIRSFSKFRGSFSTSSSPPSIVDSSASSRGRRIFGMASLLGRRAKEPQVAAELVAEKLLAIESSGNQTLSMPPSKNDATWRANDPAVLAADPSALGKSLPDEPVPTKSRTIFRKLTTRFNRRGGSSRSPSPVAVSRRRSLAVPRVPVATTLASQDSRAAALRERGLLPPLSLSEQEARQDSRIAIVASPEPAPQSSLERRPTAANQIKAEWEAKNRARLNEFRFGGNSPSRETFALRTLEEVDTPLPSPVPSPHEATDAAPNVKAPRGPPPTLNLEQAHDLAAPLLRAWSGEGPADAYTIPLPPSPNPNSLISAFAHTPAADAAFTPLSPACIPLPPSPAASQLTSPAPRPDLSESESALGVPSLMVDSESQTTVSSAAESLGSFGRIRTAAQASKVRNSTIDEFSAHHPISVIVESPGEDREPVVRTESPDGDVIEVGGYSTMPVVKVDGMGPRRRDTEPITPKPERRKSTLNIFKRGNSVRSETGAGGKAGNRRSTLFGGRKSTGGLVVGFDSSLLPPSPTLPSQFAAQQQQQQQRSMSPTGLVVANPTIHSRGSIMFETSKIENEESRRVTELAFM